MKQWTVEKLKELSPCPLGVLVAANAFGNNNFTALDVLRSPDISEDYKVWFIARSAVTTVEGRKAAAEHMGFDSYDDQDLWMCTFDCEYRRLIDFFLDRHKGA